MIIPHIPPLLLNQALQPPIPLPPLPQPILPPTPPRKRRTTQRAQPHQAQTDAKPNRILRLLRVEVDIAGDDAAAVTDPDLCGCGHGTFVMSADVIAEPDDHDGLRDVSAGGDEVESKITRADGDVVHV